MKATKSERMYFQLQALAHRTGEIESGLLLPIPLANDSRNATFPKSQQNRSSLIGNIMRKHLIPTPIASGRERYKTRAKRQGHKNAISHLDALMEYMLPTPQAMEGEKITGLENQDSLTKRARSMTGKTSQLNPRFVMEMMGFPPNWTELPFQNGEMKALKEEETQ